MKSHSLLLSQTRLVVSLLLFAMTMNQVRAAAALPNSTPLPNTVEIGVIYPLAGRLVDVNHWGDEAKPFWEQAEEDINNLPDAISQNIKFQLIVESSDSTGAGAQAATMALINNGVQAIVGFPTSSELSASMADLTKYQIATISSGSTGPNLLLRQPDTVYRIMPNELSMARKMADMVKELGYTKAAIIYRTDAWGEAYAEVFANRFQTQGGLTDSVAIKPTHPYVQDYSTEVAELSEKVMKNLGVSASTAVVMVVWEGEDLNILHHAATDKALSSVRWFSAGAGPALLTGEFGGSLSLPDASDFAFDHHLWTQENHPPQNRLAGRLLLHVEQQLGRQPRYEHVYLYDAIQLLARAILLAGTYDGASIAAQIPNAAQTYHPATGFIHFDVNGDRHTGDLAYTCMVPSGGDYEYQYCAYFYGDTRSGYFDILSPPEPRDIEWCFEC